MRAPKSRLAPLLCLIVAVTAAVAPALGQTLLTAPEAAKLLPETVFFRGQVAGVQGRNSGGLKLANGMLVLCALVDNSGYSTAIQQKYQAYFITEVPVDIAGQTLKPGAYGVGFVEGSKFVVMDVGAHDLLTTAGVHDADLKRPTPLQILPDSVSHRFRLYINRNYVIFSLH